MSNETLLYICGIALAVSAVAVSFLGLKVKGFPGKATPLIVIWFAIFVGGSTTFAVLHAKDEEAHKAAELKEADEKAEEEGGHVGPESPEGVEGNEEEKEEEAEENAEGLPEEGEVGPEEGEPGAEEQEPQVEKEEEGAAGGATEEGGGEEASGGDPEAGAEVFATNCAACHGEDGHGGAGGPDLTTMPKAQNEPEAEDQVRHGGGGMPPFEGQLDDEEIANVAAFVVQKVVGNG
jgi:mono/diheme cytochrome c family protein